MQQGSHHIVIMILVSVVLVGAVGYVFWHNIGRVLLAKRVSLNTEYRLSEKQLVAIDNTYDTFEITGFSYCPPNVACALGSDVYYTVTDSNGEHDKNYPPSKWNIDIVKTDYRTYAIIKISSNRDWKKDLADYEQEIGAENKRSAEYEDREKKRLDESMANAKVVKLNEEFTFYDDDGGGVSNEVYKITDGGATYYVEGDISPGEVFYYVYKNTMQPGSPDDKQTGIVRCEYTSEPPFGKFAMVRTDYETYATLVASHSPPVFTPKNC